MTAMPWRPGRGHWKMDGNKSASSTQVAARLARLEIIDGLRYRDVHVEAEAVDVTPCHETATDAFFRFYRLRPVGWSPAQSAAGAGLPEEWKSEAIPIPRQAHEGFNGGLARVETEFAVRSFLCRIERDIDALLLHAEERERCRARR